MNRRWRSVVITNDEYYGKLLPYIVDKGIERDTSGYYEKVHVSMLLTDEEAKTVQDWIDANL